MNERLGRSIAILFSVMLLAGGAAFLIAARLQRVISDPVIHLVQTAKAVTMLRNYGIRAQKTTDDELGMLIDGFNEMLSQIQGRDQELQKHREQPGGRDLRAHLPNCAGSTRNCARPGTGLKKPTAPRASSWPT